MVIYYTTKEKHEIGDFIKIDPFKFLHTQRETAIDEVKLHLQDPDCVVYSIEVLDNIFDANSFDGINFLTEHTSQLKQFNAKFNIAKYNNPHNNRAYMIQRRSGLHNSLIANNYIGLYFYEDWQAHVFLLQELTTKILYKTTFSKVEKNL